MFNILNLRSEFIVVLICGIFFTSAFLASLNRLISAQLYKEVSLQVEDVIRLCMESSDQLLHMGVYDWLASKEDYTQLIALAKPSLELYLKQATSNPARRDANKCADLLWKYHEHHGNHSAAAQILYSLAKTPG